MGFWRSLYDPFIALYFFGGLTLLLSLFVLVKMILAKNGADFDAGTVAGTAGTDIDAYTYLRGGLE